MQTARNVAIILGLAALVTLAPGGLTARDTVSNIITVIFLAGLGFFAYRMYMENRDRAVRPARADAGAPVRQRDAARVRTDRHAAAVGRVGPYVLIWFALIGAAAFGLRPSCVVGASTDTHSQHLGLDR